jgi:hypothetical protein
VLPQTSDPLFREAAGESITGFARRRAEGPAGHRAPNACATDRSTEFTTMPMDRYGIR